MLFSETKYFRGYDDEKIRNDSTEGLRQETFAFNISNIDKDIPIKNPYGDITHYILTKGLKEEIIHSIKVKNKLSSTTEIAVDFDNAQMVMEYYAADYIYSMFNVDLVDLSLDLFTTMFNLGEWAVVIKQNGPFLDQLAKKLKKIAYKYSWDNVNYLPIEEIQKLDYINAFVKAIDYKNQHEFRISLLPLDKKFNFDRLKIHIGSINNFATIIKTKDLISLLIKIDFIKRQQKTVTNK